MPAPKRPNTAPATAARRRSGQDTAAQALRDAGWLVIPPELVTPYLNLKTRSDRGLVSRASRGLDDSELRGDPP